MTAAQPTRVSVVVLNYNGARLLPACLDSLLPQLAPERDLLVVDNHSTDASRTLLAERYPQVRVMALSQNLGYCEGNNRGVAAVTGEYVALVNNDTVLPPEFLARLAERLDQVPRAWIVAPKIMNRSQDMSAFPLTGTQSVTGAIIQNVGSDPDWIFGASGAALMFRRAQVGLPFDPEYGFFHEDVYLSWRAWLTGHEVLVCPEVVVQHEGGATVTTAENPIRWLWERNRLLNFCCFWSPATLLKLLPLLIAAQLAEGLFDLMSGRWAFRRLRAWVWLLTHMPRVLKKRRRLQAERRVGDAVILARMSCRVTNAPHPIARGLNRLAQAWCRVLGIETYELARRT